MTTETSIYEYARCGASIDPKKTAVWFYGTELSYHELFVRIDNVADHLYALGIRTGSVVTIHLPNCPQAMIAVYAVAKLGGICNMVHPQLPVAALREYLSTSSSDLLITFLPDCAALQTGSIITNPLFYAERNDSLDDAFQSLTTEITQKAVCPDQKSLASSCAVFFHSSGTTGRPKTVRHGHAALNRSVSNVRLAYGLKDISKDGILAVLPLYHGSGFTMDMHLCLSGGATIYPMLRWDAAQAVQLIERGLVTSVTAVPKVFYVLLAQSAFHGEGLNQCFVGGDIVADELKQAFMLKTGIPLFEGYGMTETVSTCCGDRKSQEGMTAFPNCRFAVLTNQGAAPAGTGELLISSDTIMQGYLGETEQPIIEWSDKQWLKTGDYGSVSEDGVIRVWGRIKNMIIHNGYNVFPSEVERVIAELPAVKDVAVVGEQDYETGTQVVCAYVVIHDGMEAGITADIKTACDQQLSPYACPQKLKFVAEIPRNELNKARLGALQ